MAGIDKLKHRRSRIHEDAFQIIVLEDMKTAPASMEHSRSLQGGRKTSARLPQAASP